jgi:DNA-binding NarL/FixJ family response regulator
MTAEATERLNARYPVFLVHLVDDDQVDIELVEEVLHKNNLKNIKKFSSPEAYEKALDENPFITPHLAFIDFNFDGSPLNGLHITSILVKRSSGKSLPTKVFMVSDHNHPDDIITFFHTGGFAWVYKSDVDFKTVLVNKVTEAVVEITSAMEERAFLDSINDELAAKEEVSNGQRKNP